MPDTCLLIATHHAEPAIPIRFVDLLFQLLHEHLPAGHHRQIRSDYQDWNMSGPGHRKRFTPCHRIA
jgi:hypothetical protein